MINAGNGILIGEKLAIDPRRKSACSNVIISHAHADHVKLNKESQFFFSEGTMAIIESRYSKVVKPNTIAFGKKQEIGGVGVTAVNSGHILGGVSLHIDTEKTIGITTDFKTQDSLIQKGAKPIDCDVLIIESTFGLPSFTFPDRQDVYEEMGSWIKEKSKQGFVVLAGYALGKAQELTAVCNEYAGIEPLVHERVFDNNRVYEKMGTKLGGYIKLDHNLSDSPVLIMPPSLVNHNIKQVLEYSLEKRVFSAFATGWGFRSSYDKVFSLSDHADFPQLMDYVKQCNPKLVLTEHGYDNELANYIQRRLGIPAKPLDMKGQKVLSEFF